MIRAIENIIDEIGNAVIDCGVTGVERNFALISYRDTYGRSQPSYDMTKKGFSILVMGFTGMEAMKFKIAYTDRFEEMEGAFKVGQPNPYAAAIPTTFADALRLAADAMEKNEGQQLQLKQG